MTNVDVSEFNLGVTIHRGWILVETLHSTFVSLAASMKVDVLKSSSPRRKSDVTIL